MRRNCHTCERSTLVYPPNIAKCSGCGEFYNQRDIHCKDYKVTYEKPILTSGCVICKKSGFSNINRGDYHFRWNWVWGNYCFHKV